MIIYKNLHSWDCYGIYSCYSNFEHKTCRDDGFAVYTYYQKFRYFIQPERKQVFHHIVLSRNNHTIVTNDII